MDIFELVKSAPPFDPISEITRKERKSLLAVNLIALALTIGGLTPSKIETLGIGVDQIDQKGILTVLVLMDVYFLSAFLIYGVPEWLRFRSDHKLFVKRLSSFFRPNAESSSHQTKTQEELTVLLESFQDAKLVSPYKANNLRQIFEFVVPVITSLWALSLLLSNIF